MRNLAVLAPRAQQLYMTLEDGMTAAEWAQVSGCSRAEVSRHVRSLVAGGFVRERGRRPSRGRAAVEWERGATPWTGVPVQRVRAENIRDIDGVAWFAAGRWVDEEGARRAGTVSTVGDAPTWLARWDPNHPHYRRMSSPREEQITWAECGERMVLYWALGFLPWGAISVRDLWGWWVRTMREAWPDASWDQKGVWFEERRLVTAIYGTRWPDDDSAWLWPIVIRDWWVEHREGMPTWTWFLTTDWAQVRETLVPVMEAKKAAWLQAERGGAWAERVLDVTSKTDPGPVVGALTEEEAVAAVQAVPPPEHAETLAGWNETMTPPIVLQDVRTVAASVYAWERPSSGYFDPGPSTRAKNWEAYWKACPAASVCERAQVSCGPDCLGWAQLRLLYEWAEIPRRYVQPGVMVVPPGDAQAWHVLEQYEANIRAVVEEGRGLYLWSATRGNGKTTWATRLLRAYALEVALTNPAKARILFVNVPEALQRIRRSFDGAEKVGPWLKRMQTADVVVFDDIGVEKPSEWVLDTLYGWVNHREMAGMATIYTSNLSLHALETRLGERTVSRIAGQCDQIELTGTDRRWL